MSQLNWTYEQFMESTYHFYITIVQNWAIFNGAKPKKHSKKEEKVYQISELPSHLGW